MLPVTPSTVKRLICAGCPHASPISALLSPTVIIRLPHRTPSAHDSDGKVTATRKTRIPFMATNSFRMVRQTQLEYTSLNRSTPSESGLRLEQQSGDRQVPDRLQHDA